MNIQFKIIDQLLGSIRADLARPHEFAYERVGFLTTKTAFIDNGALVYAFDYIRVLDSQYIYDPSVGARIDQSAVTNALNNALMRKCGIFHVHAHHLGPMLWFSPTDIDDQNAMIPDFFKVSKSQIHGSLVLGPQSMTGRPWLSEDKPTTFKKLQVVGRRHLIVAPTPEGYTEFK